MKIFISWSGPLSKSVALALRAWLKSVIQTLRPFMSETDIPSGAKWLVNLSSELQDTRFGILCVTRNNVHAPWLNYEAGLLSREVNDDTRVVPLLINFDSPLPQGPLAQFQSLTIDRENLRKLVQDVNEIFPAADRLNDAELLKQFDRCWPEFQRQIDSAIASHGSTPDVSKKDPTTEMLEELLALVREQTRILNHSQRGDSRVFQQALLRRLDDIQTTYISVQLPDTEVETLDRVGAILRAVGVQAWSPTLRGNLLHLGLATTEDGPSVQNVADALRAAGFSILVISGKIATG